LNTRDSSAERTTLNKPYIAIVDDDPAFASYLRTFLSQRGYDARCYSRGDELLAAMKQSEIPDAVLLDVMMPEMDGPTTLRHLQADAATRDIPVILLTAKVLTGERQQWEELAIRGVIAKPFDPMGLHTEVARLAGWSVA